MGAIPLMVQGKVPVGVAGVAHPPWPGRGIANCPPKTLLWRLRMLMAIGSIFAVVSPKAGAISAADVVPSAFLGNAWIVGDSTEPLGSMPLRARTAWKLKNQKPPSFGIGPLPLPPQTFCSKRPRFFP